jgi:hypothetical protein
MIDIKILPTLLTIAFSLLSAFLWIKSATAKVHANNEPSHDSWGGGSVQDGEGNDVVKTLKKQSFWNTWAAVFAALASICQALSTYYI